MERISTMGASHGTAGARAAQGQSSASEAQPKRAAEGDPTSGRAPAQHACVKGLVFDMDDVLYDATLWRRWLLQLLGRLGLKADYHTFYRTWDAEFLADVHRGRRE